jgi:hypothetical protein
MTSKGSRSPTDHMPVVAGSQPRLCRRDAGGLPGSARNRRTHGTVPPRTPVQTVRRVVEQMLSAQLAREFVPDRCPSACTSELLPEVPGPPAKPDGLRCVCNILHIVGELSTM